MGGSDPTAAAAADSTDSADSDDADGSRRACCMLGVGSSGSGVLVTIDLSSGRDGLGITNGQSNRPGGE